MKTLFFPLILALSTVLNLHAQNFPLQGNEKWAYNQWQQAFNPPGGITIDTWKFYELRGDTLLNGVKWFKLYHAVYEEVYTTFPYHHGESFVIPAPNGFLRDSADVWLYRASANAPPEILFSFGLQIGEKFFPNDVCLVEEISATNAVPPRRIEAQTPPFNNGFATKLIEGVGTVHSFFIPACSSCFSFQCQYSISLKCFKQNGLEIPLGLSQDCAKSELNYQKILDYQKQTPTHEAGFTPNSRFRLVPNPGFDKVKIEFLEQGFGSFRAGIFDLSGKLLIPERTSSSPELDVSALKAGIYIVRVSETGNGQVAYSRFVKL